MKHFFNLHHENFFQSVMLSYWTNKLNQWMAPSLPNISKHHLPWASSDHRCPTGKICRHHRQSDEWDQPFTPGFLQKMEKCEWWWFLGNGGWVWEEPIPNRLGNRDSSLSETHASWGLHVGLLVQAKAPGNSVHRIPGIVSIPKRDWCLYKGNTSRNPPCITKKGRP